jgi:hypothetical protein
MVLRKTIGERNFTDEKGEERVEGMDAWSRREEDRTGE